MMVCPSSITRDRTTRRAQVSRSAGLVGYVGVPEVVEAAVVWGGLVDTITLAF